MYRGNGNRYQHERSTPACPFCEDGRCIVLTGLPPRCIPCPDCGRQPVLTEYQKKVLLY